MLAEILGIEPEPEEEPDALVAAAFKSRTMQERLDWFDRIVAKSLRKAIRAGTSALGETVTAAAEAVSLDDLAAIESTWRNELAREIMPALGQVYMEGADDTIQGVLRKSAAVAGPTLDLRSAAAEVHLSDAHNRLVGVGNSEWERIRTRLVDGMAQGEDVSELSRRVREELAASTVRAQTIARTEVVSASNAGSLAQAKALGRDGPAEKIWIATHDGRTRFTHQAADGQIVPIDDTFRVGHSRLAFPGDPSGAAEEVINCRCTLGWITNEADTIEQTADFTPHERDAVSQYMADPDLMNTYLRGQQLAQPWQVKTINDMQSAILKNKTTKPLKVYRAARGDWIGDLRVGDYVTEPGFASATVSREEAIAELKESLQEALFEIAAPKDYPLLNAAYATAPPPQDPEEPPETEVVMPFGAALKILNIGTSATIVGGQVQSVQFTLVPYGAWIEAGTVVISNL